MSRPTILQKILAAKAREIEHGKARLSRQALEAQCAGLRAPRGFRQRLESAAASGPAVIAEIKKASPSAGVIRADFDPAGMAADYEAAGATCLSVLTDAPFFQGHNDFLRQARDACSLPVLRKEFIVDPWQVLESRALGADCILLIAAILEPLQLQDLAGLAAEHGLDVLVEVHDPRELEAALAVRGCLLGVNNRNLHTFETDLATSEMLRRRVPAGRLLVTESGMRTRADVRRMLAAGIRAFLVGEAFMREPDPGAALRRLFFAVD